jgi:hypothetical protein
MAFSLHGGFGRDFFILPEPFHSTLFERLQEFLS